MADGSDFPKFIQISTSWRGDLGEVVLYALDEAGRTWYYDSDSEPACWCRLTDERQSS